MRSIFVSSTFRDMQAERDLLHTDIIPALNAYAEEYQDYLHFIDLRWGVNTNELDSDESAHKVLNVCLDEIDKSKPYMLIFIGERYGWIPEHRYIAEVSKSKNFHVDASDRSVTALEIEYGLLTHAGNADRCIICIRNPLDLSLMDEKTQQDYRCEDEEHRIHLEKLKAKLRERFGDRIIEYDAEWDSGAQKLTGLDKLRDEILNRFLSMFNADWQNHQELSAQERIYRTSLHKLQFQAKISAGNDSFVELILQNMNEAKALIYLKGTPGSGKTKLLCQTGAALSERGFSVMPFFCGSDDATTGLHELLSYLIWCVEREMGMEEHCDTASSSLQFLQKYFTQLVFSYQDDDATNELVFLIDDIHKLVNDSYPMMFFMHDSPCSKVNFIITCPEELELDPVPEFQSFSEEMYLYGLAFPVQARLMIYNILDRHHKELDVEVVDAIIDQGDCYNPLYINLLVNRLLMMDSTDLRSANNAAELNAQMLRIVTEFPSDTGEAAYSYLMAAGEKISPEIASDVFLLLAVAPDGLREHDLERICADHHIPWSTVDFTRLMRYLKPFVAQKDSGFLSFDNEVVSKSLAAFRETDVTEYRGYILKYIKGLDTKDRLYQTSGLKLALEMGDTAFTTAALKATQQNPKVAEQTAKRLIKLLRTGGNDIVRQAIREVESAKDFRWLLSFFCEWFYPQIDKTQTDQIYGLQIFSTLAEAAERKYSDSENQESFLGNTAFAGMYNRLAAQYEGIDENESVRLMLLAADFASAELAQRPSLESLYNHLVGRYKIAGKRYAQNDYAQVISDLQTAMAEIDAVTTQNNLKPAQDEEYARRIMYIEGNCDILLSASALRHGQRELSLLHAESAYQKLMMVYRALGDNDSLEALAKALINYEEVAETCGKPEELLAKIINEVVGCYRELYKRTGRTDHLRFAVMFMKETLDLQNGADFDEKLADEAIHISESLFKQYQDLSDLKRAYQITFRKAVFYYQSKHWQETYDTMQIAVKQAEYYLREADELDSQTVNQIAEFNRQLSVLLNEFNEMEPAIHYAGRAVQLFGMVWSQTGHAEASTGQAYALSMGCLAEDYAKVKDFGHSKEFFEKQLEVHEIIAKQHPAAVMKERWLNCLKNLYIVHMNMGEEETALIYRRRAEDMMQ
ncbi:MAG: DUF4062 domain-containing protein [Ruminiclostridium sp.]|nr:DUF4062 domain-containing protein [Ruminiclostridium sp.]